MERSAVYGEAAGSECPSSSLFHGHSLQTRVPMEQEFAEILGHDILESQTIHFRPHFRKCPSYR